MRASSLFQLNKIIRKTQKKPKQTKKKLWENISFQVSLLMPGWLIWNLAIKIFDIKPSIEKNNLTKEPQKYIFIISFLLIL